MLSAILFLLIPIHHEDPWIDLTGTGLTIAGASSDEGEEPHWTLRPIESDEPQPEWTLCQMSLRALKKIRKSLNRMKKSFE